MKKFCIYYSDGTKFSYLDGDIGEAPCSGVQFIAQESSNGYNALCNYDYYLLEDRGDGLQFYCSDIVGYWIYMFKAGFKLVMFGEWINDSRYEEISRQVSKDIQIARKTGYAPWERNPNEQR